MSRNRGFGVIGGGGGGGGGGATRNGMDFVFRPGGAAGGNVYTSDVTLSAAVAAAYGARRVFVDTSMGVAIWESTMDFKTEQGPVEVLGTDSVVATTALEIATGANIRGVSRWTDLDITVTSTTVQDVAVFSTCLSATNADVMNALGRGTLTESTADRLSRLADAAGVPAAWRDITTESVAEVDQLAYAGQSALAAMQQVERGEQGRLFVSADGLLTFAYRWAAYTAASAITLSDDGAGQGYSGTIQIRQSDQDMLNDITVSNATTSVQYIDTTAVTADGPYADAIDTNLSTSEQMESMAFGLVNERKTQTTRMEPILLGYPSDWPTVLALELNQKMTVEHTPMGVGSQASYSVIISQIAWSITGASGWRCTLAGAPLPAVSYWILDVSTLGTDTTPGY